jgi:hypothetical protein
MPRSRLGGSFLIFFSLAGVACGITLVFLGMRAVMEIGGACAEGATPYVIARPCPKGVPAAVLGGVWGGLACLGVYVAATAARQVPSLLPFAWPALFLSLGWNFLEFGVRPPGGGGVAWAWILCGVLFVGMGGIPLWIGAGGAARRFRGGGAASASHARDPGVRWRVPVAAEPSAAAFSGAPESAGTIFDEPGAELVERLERLASLHRSGALDDAEYRAAKARVLGAGGAP